MMMTSVMADDQALQILRRGKKAIKEHVVILSPLHHRAQRGGDIARGEEGAYLIQRHAEGQ